MPKIPANLTGTAGEHFVAYKLSCLGIVAALPRGGALGVDVLASSLDGAKTIAIQVKTTDWASRDRGRGPNKVAYELQFPLGHKSASLNNPNLIFAFVDLRGVDNHDLQPDVYLVPSDFVFRYCGHLAFQIPMLRLHIRIEQLEQFKNNWGIVQRHLDRNEEEGVTGVDQSP